MSTILRTIALALCLAATPACSSLRGANPIPAEASLEQNAYALIGAYALTLEEATVLVKNPATPTKVKTALAKAERVATPAVELVKIAAIAHHRAQTGETGAALSRALAEAQGPAVALAALIAK
jgi:hypothetical protein